MFMSVSGCLSTRQVADGRPPSCNELEDTLEDTYLVQVFSPVFVHVYKVDHVYILINIHLHVSVQVRIEL